MSTPPERFRWEHLDADRLYRDLVYPRAEESPEAAGFDIVALPGEAPRTPPQSEDLLIRVEPGRRGRGHLAILSDGQLIGQDRLNTATTSAERGGPGFYATVTDNGPMPHTPEDRFARLILDAHARTPFYQILLRPTPSELPAAPGEEPTKGGDSAPGGQLVLPADSVTPDLVLRWNAMTAPTRIDVVVHFHGNNARQQKMRVVDDILPISGLDFADPDDPSSLGQARATRAGTGEEERREEAPWEDAPGEALDSDLSVTLAASGAGTRYAEAFEDDESPETDESLETDGSR